MSNNKDKDFFWQIQGATSFCKAKNDWLPFDRIHLSFVKHEGKNNGCKQVSSIEGTLKVHGADGALALFQLVTSGVLKARASQSRKAAGNGNAEPVFKSIGGTTSSRSKDGNCQFRQFSIIPGSKSDYTLVMMTCAGEENATGGVQPVKNAQRTSIYVPMSTLDLVDMVTSMKSEYDAYRTAQFIAAPGHNVPEAASAKEASQPQQEPASKEKPKEESPKLLLIAYDSLGLLNGGKPAVTYLDSGRKLLNSMVTAFGRESFELKDDQVVKELGDAVKTGKTGVWALTLSSKEKGETANIVAIIDHIWH